MRRLVYLLVALLLVGCAGRPSGEPAPSQPPPETAPTASAPAGAPSETPAPPPRQAARPETPAPPPKQAPRAAPPAPAQFEETFSLFGNFAGRITLADGLQRAVDLNEVTAFGMVKAESAESARQRITVAGADAWYTVRQNHDRWDVSARILPGPPGQKISITYQSEPPMTVTLTRQQGPTVSLLHLGPDGTWREVTSGTSLPPGPLRLRIKTTGGVPASYLSSRFMGAEWSGGKISPDRFEVLASDLAEVAWENPPPIVQVMAGSLEGEAGLRLPYDYMPHVYIGTPPQLVAIDPATGREEVLGEAPSTLFYGEVRTDSKVVAFSSMDPVLQDATRAWLFDLERRTLVAAPFTSHYGIAAQFDAAGRLVQPLRGPQIGLLNPATGKHEIRRSQANYFGPLSPDGRYLAGHTGGEPGRSTGAWIPPAQPEVLVIHDLMTGKEVVVPWEGYARPHMPLYWLPGGELIQVVSMSDSPEDRDATVYQVDPQTGARTPFTKDWAEPYSKFGRWSAILTDTSGKQHDFADGMPIGWLSDGRALVVRWENFRHRRQWAP